MRAGDAGDAGDGSDSDVVTVVRTGDGEVRLPASALRGVATGATVHVRLRGRPPGVSVTESGADAAALPAAQAADPEAGPAVAAVQVLAQPAQSNPAQSNPESAASGPEPAVAGQVSPSSVGAVAGAVHQVTVVRARWSGLAPDGMSTAALVNAVNSQVAPYWSEVTGAAVSFQAVGPGGLYDNSWAVVDESACANGDSTSNAFDFWDAVAARIGWQPAPGKHLLVYFPQTTACGGTAGLGTIGTAGPGSGGVAWTNGSTALGVIGHELGHNLGLGHSSELSCSAAGLAVTDAPTASCAVLPYWDLSDIMALSWGNVGYLNAVHQAQLGVLGAAVTDVTASATVTLSAMASGSGTRVARLRWGSDVYYLEYRGAVGRDAFLANTRGRAGTGVSVRKVPGDLHGFSPYDSYLLDGDPATNDRSYGQIQQVLPTGSWTQLAGGATGVQVLSASPAGAVVQFSLGSDNAGRATASSTSTARLVPGALKRRPGRVLAPVLIGWGTTAAQLTPSTPAGAALRTTVAAGTNRWVTTTVSLAGVAGAPSTAAGAIRARLTAESRDAGYRGRWKASRSGAAVGGTERVTRARKASVVATVQGTSVGVVAVRGPGRGKFAVYVDGRKAGTVDLRSGRTRASGLVWAAPLTGGGQHRITLVRQGKSTALLGYDGLVVLS
ncbi:MAG: hypothetical protein EPO13_08590 [Actinomycetota bacterium]|nr:MAG: hypothetical protein EPO13_08590 [Actinomycetota bacterium]